MAVVGAMLGFACGGDSGEPSDDEGAGASGGSPTTTGPGGTGGTATGTTTGMGGTATGTGTGEPMTCTSHAECPTNTVCLFSSCELAWGKNFRFTAVSVTNIPGTDPMTGNAWDVAGGAPDPFVQMFAGTTDEVLSAPVMDTFSATWNFTADVLADFNGPDLEFYVWDNDVDAPDYMIGQTAAPEVWLSVVKEFGGVSEVTDPASGMTFTMMVDVVP